MSGSLLATLVNMVVLRIKNGKVQCFVLAINYKVVRARTKLAKAGHMQLITPCLHCSYKYKERHTLPLALIIPPGFLPCDA